MMTSRAEYRLLHRQDNADIRMSHLGLRIGTISSERHESVMMKYEIIDNEIKRLETTFLPPGDEANQFLEERGESPIISGISLASLLRRPKLSYRDIALLEKSSSNLPAAVTEQVEISIKYDGYIKRQQRQQSDLVRMENYAIPDDIDYNALQGLRIEARQKLSDVKPLNLGQAMRISGVSPADAAALMIHMKNSEFGIRNSE